MGVHLGAGRGNGMGRYGVQKKNYIPESSDVNWDTDLEVIVKTSTICALIAKDMVHVCSWSYNVTSHSSNELTAAAPAPAQRRQPGWEQ